MAMHLALLVAVTTGIGMAMTRLGIRKGMLSIRANRRHCACCGRLMRRWGGGCDRCGF
jgi:hypothetical protein